MKPIAVLGDHKAAHGYDVEVTVPGDTSGTFQYVYVHATNRNQAARIAEKAGYEVRSVNMIG
jgi:hypothetical protein